VVGRNVVPLTCYPNYITLRVSNSFDWTFCRGPPISRSSQSITPSPVTKCPNLSQTPAFHIPSTKYASSSPGQGGIVIALATKFSTLSSRHRNWNAVPTRIVTHVPFSNSVISSLSPSLRHICPLPEITVHISSTVLWATASDVWPGLSSKSAAEPRSVFKRILTREPSGALTVNASRAFSVSKGDVDDIVRRVWVDSEANCPADAFSESSDASDTPNRGDRIQSNKPR